MRDDLAETFEGPRRPTPTGARRRRRPLGWRSVLAVVAVVTGSLVFVDASTADAEPFPRVDPPAGYERGMTIDGDFVPGGSVAVNITPPVPPCATSSQTECFNQLTISPSSTCVFVNHNSSPDGGPCVWGNTFSPPQGIWDNYVPRPTWGDCFGARFDYAFVSGGPNGTPLQWPGAGTSALQCTLDIDARFPVPNALQGPTWMYLNGGFTICEVTTAGNCTQWRGEWVRGLIWLVGDADPRYLGPDPSCSVTQSGPGGRVVRFQGSVANGDGGYFREWSFQDGTTSTSPSVTITVDRPGVFGGTFRTWTRDGRVDESVSCSATVARFEGPTAAFSYEASASDPREIAFTNRSTHPESLPMTYEWTFEEGVTSADVDPTHTFPGAGTYPVTLRATDDAGQSDLVTSEVVIEPGNLVVNSTGDAGATDVAERRCDTGNVVGGGPECTLRAAIETANAEGGGEITFAIAGGGVPTIAPTENLPELTSSITVDGTTQAGGFVKIDGTNTITRALVLNGGTSRVTGLVIDGYFDAFAIVLQGGTGHVIEGNRIGTTVDGNGLGGVAYGISAFGVADLEVRGNVLHCVATCISVYDEPGSVVTGNSISVGANGAAFGGRTPTGILLSRTSAEVSDNEVNASLVGILVRDAGTGGSVISGNFVGATRAGDAALGPDYGIRIDAAPGVTVTENVVGARGPGGILVTGSSQITSAGQILRPSDDAREGPVTGGRVDITGNRVGVLPDGTTAGEGSASDGVVVWADASDVTIRSNVIANQRRAGVLLRGGSGHVVSGNSLGTIAGLASPFGVRIEEATNVTIGGSGQGNAIRASDQSVTLADGVVGVRVIGNDIADTAVGIGSPGAADDEQTVADATIAANTIAASSLGVNLGGTVSGAAVSDNTIEGGELAGVLVGAGATDVEVRRNTILGADRGVTNRSPGTVIASNRIGIGASGTVSGSALAGIAVAADATVTGNVIVGSGDFGVVVGADAIGRLEGNEIHQTTGIPIQTESGPAEPEIAAAIRSAEGEAQRTLLVVTGLPGEGGGTVEIFANDDCADPEARYVLGVTERTRPGRTWAVVPVLGRGDRDHFTATYTSPTDGTSALSGCEARASYPDRDGDGTVDPIEELVGTDADPTQAILVTDDGDLLLVDADDGELRDVRSLDDPDPDGGVALAHGVIGFRVVGLEPGAATTVRVGIIDGPSTGGDAYWKYGSPEPGSSDRWHRFDPDEATATGAESAAVDYGGEIGLRRMWVLSLVDGERGDHDGVADGTIVDPGGPGSGAADPPPTDPVGPTSPTAPNDPAPTEPRPEAVRPGGVRPDDPERVTLARTGSDSSGLVATALALVLAGVLVLRGRTRTRSA